MKETQKKPWIAIAIVVIALCIAVFSGIRTFAPARLLPMDQQVAQEKETHDKLQQELQQKYGIKPVPYGMQGASGAVKGQVPTDQAAAANASH